MTNPRPDDDQLPKYYQSDAYISHSNKSLTFIDRAYKIVRRFTLSWKYKLILKYSEKGTASVLDFGCGTGSFLQKCRQHGIKISGVEPSETARQQAIRDTGTEIVSTPNNLTDQYDVITLWHVLEHVSNFNETLALLRSHLTENGTIFIAVPNLNSLDANIFRQRWAGYDVPRHLWHFNIKTMERILTQNHLRLTNILPMKLDAYYVSLLSEKYKNPKGGVSNIARAMLLGWKSNRAAHTTGEYSSLIYIARK